ncbi:MAG: amidohydrolase family protein [Saprospiraceae bacterium]
MKRTITLIAVVFVACANMMHAQSKVKAIKAGRLIDVTSGSILKNQIILIQSDTIFAIGAAVIIPKDAEIIDLGDATVLPGLIDCHTHITAEPSNDYYGDIFRKTAMDYAIRAPIYAKHALEAGFTTCRDLGSGELIDISLRNAINEGVIEGPRLFVATFALGATGGHSDLSGFNPNISSKGNPDFTGVADGVDEIKKRVRNNVKWGADVIKVCATAGVLSEEESVGAPQYSLEEMKALVDEAHMWGRKVAAHAHGTEGIKRAVLAGVNSVEHGSILDEETIQLMKEKGTYYVPTIYVAEYVIKEFAKKGFPEKILNKGRSIAPLMDISFTNAVKAGLKIAFGTDAGVFPHGLNARQFALMVKYGQTPMQAIQSATINAADLLGQSAKIGTIEKGKFADIIAVRGNPLENISILEDVSFVMKGGVVYKNEMKN